MSATEHFNYKHANSEFHYISLQTTELREICQKCVKIPFHLSKKTSNDYEFFTGTRFQTRVTRQFPSTMPRFVEVENIIPDKLFVKWLFIMQNFQVQTIFHDHQPRRLLINLFFEEKSSLRDESVVVAAVPDTSLASFEIATD
jgi:hypothetical protein